MAALAAAVCVGVLALPTVASASDGDPGKPQIGACKTKVDKVKTTPKGKSAAQKKASKQKMADGGNQQALTSGVTIICT